MPTGYILPATAAGAELEDGVEGVVEHLPVARLDVLDEPVAIGGERGLGEPAPDVGRGRRRELSGGFGLRDLTECSVGRGHGGDLSVEERDADRSAAGPTSGNHRAGRQTGRPGDSGEAGHSGYPDRAAFASHRRSPSRTAPTASTGCKTARSATTGTAASVAITRNFRKLSGISRRPPAVVKTASL